MGLLMKLMKLRKKMPIKRFMAAACLAASTSASALVTYTSSTDQGVTPPDDDFAPEIPVLFGREVYLDDAATVTMTAIYSEASYTNALITVGGVEYSNVIDGSSLTFVADAGLLPFGFFVTDTALSVINGGNQLAWESAGEDPFFAVTPVEVSDGMESFYIALDDGGFGDKTGSDLDDFVIRVDVEPVVVPEPMPAVLLGLGLIGVGLTRLRRKVQ
jgi:hypothetical protein